MKRLVDLILTSIGLVILSPVFLVVAFLVRVRLGRPVFFRQIRAGWKDRPFELIKFRTMTDEKDPDGQLLPDAERLPPFGSWLRSTSLDELPELINILKGEMSLVGPRPLFMSYLPHYSPEQKRRHEVRPGLTGWAQINGRNSLGWPERLQLDTWYVDNRSLLLDFRILLQTAVKVIKREGIAEDGEASMRPFTNRGDRR